MPILKNVVSLVKFNDGSEHINHNVVARFGDFVKPNVAKKVRVRKVAKAKPAPVVAESERILIPAQPYNVTFTPYTQEEKAAFRQFGIRWFQVNKLLENGELRFIEIKSATGIGPLFRVLPEQVQVVFE